MYKSPKSRRESKRLKKRTEENLKIASAIARVTGCDVTGAPLHEGEYDWHHPERGKIRLSKAAQKSRRRFLQEIAACICVKRGAHVAWHKFENLEYVYHRRENQSWLSRLKNIFRFLGTP